MTYIFTNGMSLIIYISVYAISSVLYLHKDRIYLGAKKAQWINTLFIIAIPIIFAAVRYNVGADYHVYVAGINRYDNVTIMDYLRGADLISGEPIGMVIVKKLSQGSPVLYFGILSFLTYGPIVYALMKKWGKLPNSVLALAVFFYLMNGYSTSFNIIKQSIAISFVFCSLIFVYDRKPIKFIMTIFCAYFFHQTALAILPIYLMWNKNLNVTTLKKLLSFLAAIFVIFGLNTILEFVGGGWVEYIDSNGTDNKIFFVYIFWMIVFLVFYKDLTNLDKRNELLILLYSLGAILNSIGFWSVFGKRIGLYFTIQQFLLMGQLPLCERIKKNSKFVHVCLIIYTVAMFIYIYYISGQSVIIPYGFSI